MNYLSIATSLETKWLWSLPAVLLVLMGIAIFQIIKHDKRLKKENEVWAESVVEKIIGQVGQPFRQRWVDDDTVEFVALILGGMVGGELGTWKLIWARVHIAMNVSKITICYSPQVSGDYSISCLVEGFARRGWAASAELCYGQPDPAEYEYQHN